MNGLYKTAGVAILTLGAYACTPMDKKQEPTVKAEMKESLPEILGKYEGTIDKLVEDKKISPSRKIVEDGKETGKYSQNEYQILFDTRKAVGDLKEKAKGTAYEGRHAELVKRIEGVYDKVANGNGIKPFVLVTLKEGGVALHGAELGKPFFVKYSIKDAAGLAKAELDEVLGKVQYRTTADQLGYPKSTNFKDSQVVAVAMYNTFDVPTSNRGKVIDGMEGDWKESTRTFDKDSMKSHLSGNQVVHMRIGGYADETLLDPSAKTEQPKEGSKEQPKQPEQPKGSKLDELKQPK
jgi:hypothetical protein